MPDAKDLISIVMPVYNGSEDLQVSIEGVLAQSYDAIELICIDDGSTDSSLSILKRYEAKDPRIRVFTQSNNGAGAARNYGLSLAKGSYILFLDADDVFEPSMVTSAYQACVRHQADFCLFGSDQFVAGSKRHFKGNNTINLKLLPSDTLSFCFRDIKEDHFCSMLGWAWDKLYSMEFVQSNGLRFLEQHNSEDMFFVFCALVAARRITVVDKVFVHQKVGGGQSLSQNRAKHPLDFYTSLMALKSYLINNGLFDDLERSFVSYALLYSVWNLTTLPGKAFEQLYVFLKAEGFKELGISGRPAEYFFDTADYLAYQRIMEMDPIEFLQFDLSRLRARIDALIGIVPFGLGYKAAAWYSSRHRKNV